MIRLGIVHNPRSERNRRAGGALRRAAAAHSDVLFADLERIADLPAILTDFARREVGLIAVDGGDGTVQAVLTGVINGTAYPKPPPLAVLPSGMTNAIAADVGFGHRGAAALRRLADAAAADRLDETMVTRPLIRMDCGDAPGHSVYGMVFGAAAFYRGIRFARARIHTLKLKRTAAAGAALAALLAGAVGRRGDPELLRGDPIGIAVGNGDIDLHHRFLLVATTLQRHLLGVRPFWGGGDGALSYLDIAAPPPRLAAALLPTLLGRPRPWMADDYRSGRTNRLTLDLDTPFVLDGEIFEPPPNRQVTLSAGPAVRFLRP